MNLDWELWVIFGGLLVAMLISFKVSDWIIGHNMKKRRDEIAEEKRRDEVDNQPPASP